MTIIMIGTKNGQFGTAGDSRTIVNGSPGIPVTKTFSLYGGNIVGAFEYNMSLANKTIGEWIVDISKSLNGQGSLKKFIDLFVPKYESLLNNRIIDRSPLNIRSSKLLLVARKSFSAEHFEMAHLHFEVSENKVKLITQPYTIHFMSNDRKVSTGKFDSKIAAENFFDKNRRRIDDIKELLRQSIEAAIKATNDISIGDEPTVEIGI